MDELRSWIVLSRVPALHAGTLKALLTRFGSVAQITGSTAHVLTRAGVPEKLAHQVNAAAAADISNDIRWLERDSRHHLVQFDDARYPTLLREINDAPIALFVRGDPTCLNDPQIAVVGSRNPTPNGREIAYDWATSLARSGLTITSGLALGIDAAAHRGALDATARTIAVCGTGVDVIYPRAHRELADRIVTQGAVISEFPIGARALKTNFPRRNRVISAMSLGTLVVEAALRSGSLITARTAASQGREVFAIPGSIRNPMARGCHELLRQGAKLVETPDEVICELGPLAATLISRTHLPALAASEPTDALLDKEYEILLDALGFDPVSVDQVITRTGLKSGDVASMLLLLELDGHVQSFPGGVYVRTRP